MKVSAAEVLYQKFGIISEKDYFKRADYIAPSHIQFIRQYDSKEDFLQDYVFSDIPRYMVRGICFDYKNVTRNHFNYQVGYTSGDGVCVYTESEEVHKTIKLSSVEYLCMCYAIQVFEDYEGLLQVLDDCAQKYGRTSEQVKQIWYGFLYKDNALSLRMYHKSIKEFCSDNNLDNREFISFPLDEVLQLVLDRNEAKTSVVTKPIKCQICEPIKTIKQQEIIEKKKEIEETVDWWRTSGLEVTIIVVIVIVGIILNGVGYYAGQDEDSVLYDIILFGGLILGFIDGIIFLIKENPAKEFIPQYGVVGGCLSVLIMFMAKVGSITLWLGCGGLMLANMLSD